MKEVIRKIIREGRGRRDRRKGEKRG